MSTKSPSPTRSSTTVGTIELLAAMVLSGTIGVFVVESGTDPVTVVFYRCLFGAIALGLYCLARGYLTNTGLNRRSLSLVALGGVFIVFNWVFLFESFERTSITLATVVYHTQPFYVVLIGSIVFRERLTWSKVGAVVVAFLGVVLVSNVLVAGGELGSDYLIGLGSALLAAVFYAFATLIAKSLKGLRPHVVALIQVTLGIVILAPLASPGSVGGWSSAWLWLIGLGVIHTGVMYVLMYSSYQKLQTATIAVLSFVYPAVAIVVDRVVYGTRIDLLQVVGIVMIAVASLSISLGWSPRFGRSVPTDPAASAPDAAVVGTASKSERTS